VSANKLIIFFNYYVINSQYRNMPEEVPSIRDEEKLPSVNGVSDAAVHAIFSEIGRIQPSSVNKTAGTFADPGLPSAGGTKLSLLESVKEKYGIFLEIRDGELLFEGESISNMDNEAFAKKLNDSNNLKEIQSRSNETTKDVTVRQQEVASREKPKSHEALDDTNAETPGIKKGQPLTESAWLKIGDTIVKYGFGAGLTVLVLNEMAQSLSGCYMESELQSDSRPFKTGTHDSDCTCSSPGAQTLCANRCIDPNWAAGNRYVDSCEADASDQHTCHRCVDAKWSIGIVHKKVMWYDILTDMAATAGYYFEKTVDTAISVVKAAVDAAEWFMKNWWIIAIVVVVVVIIIGVAVGCKDGKCSKKTKQPPDTSSTGVLSGGGWRSSLNQYSQTGSQFTDFLSTYNQHKMMMY